jgi:hypothetical protein
MKTRFASIFIAISLFIFLNPAVSIGQSAEEKCDKVYEWDGEDQSETIYISIKKESASMIVNLVGTVKKGKLEVSLISPDGEKIPGFLLVSDGSSDESLFEEASGTNQVTTSASSVTSTTVSTSSTSSSTRIGSSGKKNGKGKNNTTDSYVYSTSEDLFGEAKGVMNKVITNPTPGNWKVVISAKKVNGKLVVSIDQD